LNLELLLLLKLALHHGKARSKDHQFFRSLRKPTSAGILAVMCGRYALVKSAGELIEEFEITTNSISRAIAADWNIAPTRDIYLIKSGRELTTDCSMVKGSHRSYPISVTGN
jgi:hypothetical protein